MREENIRLYDKKDFQWLLYELQDLNSYGRLNCLLSDGINLFCYHDQSGYNGLSYVQRKTPFGTIKLKDEDYQINLKEEKKPSQEGYIIASQPLSDEQWQNFNEGELIVIKKGKIIFKETL